MSRPSIGSTNTPDEIRRLAFIRHIVQLGNTQANQPEPFASTAVLLWHDAIELFLHLSAAHVGAKMSGRGYDTIMEYFHPINESLGERLPRQPNIGQLSRARDNLKHAGVRPAYEDIVGFARTVSGFFEQSVPMVFGIPLDRVSLNSFVLSDRARDELDAAVRSLENADPSDGVICCARAFHYLIEDYDRRVRERFGRSAFYHEALDTSEGIGSQLFIGSARWRSEFYDGHLDGDVERLHKESLNMQTQLNVLSLGIDRRDYMRFRLVSPRRWSRIKDGQRVVEWLYPEDITPPTLDDLRFSIDFVIRSALRIQEFAFVY